MCNIKLSIHYPMMSSAAPVTRAIPLALILESLSPVHLSAIDTGGCASSGRFPGLWVSRYHSQASQLLWCRHPVTLELTLCQPVSSRSPGGAAAQAREGDPVPSQMARAAACSQGTCTTKRQDVWLQACRLLQPDQDG